jgi:hypothetical protein
VVAVVAGAEVSRAEAAGAEVLKQHGEKGRKGGARFPKPAYIHWLADEYIRTHNSSSVSHIFVCHVTDEYMGASDDQTGRPIYSSVPYPTDEFNLNIFVGINKFKITNK